jgi:predicted RNase H-like nuclease
MIVVGVDGCKFGWVAAKVEIESEELPKTLSLKSFLTFEEIVDAYVSEAAAIAVDIPIGLIECQRSADIDARAVLSKRKSSVFPAPDPRVVDLDDYQEANSVMRKFCGKGVSKQAFALFPKVREVNEVVARRDPKQENIIEIHPEICFWAMNDERAMCHPKRTVDGYAERRNLLSKWLDFDLWRDPLGAGKQSQGAGADDVLDAIAAAWTARRWAVAPREAKRFPVDEKRDADGLRAEIVY